MSESVFSKIDDLSNERKPREYRALNEWQKKLIVEYYPAIDYEELIEFFDVPKSTISGIARRNGVKRLKSKMDSEKLKPCPMCGKKHALIIQTWREALSFHDIEIDDEQEWYQVVCAVNKDGCGVSGRYAKTPEEAAAHWNTRHEARKTISMIEYDAPQRFYIDAQVDGVSIGQLSGGKDEAGIRDDAIKILKKLGFRWE